MTELGPSKRDSAQILPLRVNLYTPSVLSPGDLTMSFISNFLTARQ